MGKDLERRATLFDRAVSGVSLVTEIVRVPVETTYQGILLSAELIGGVYFGYWSSPHTAARNAAQRIGRNYETLVYGVK